jgi:hypothetical protein
MRGETRTESMASADDHAVFDLDGTLRRLGGDTGLLAELIRLYAEDSPDLLRRMATGIESRRGDQQLGDAPKLFKTVQHESARLQAVLAQYAH